MKKRYLAPKMEAVNVEAAQILAASQMEMSIYDEIVSGEPEL